MIPETAVELAKIAGMHQMMRGGSPERRLLIAEPADLVKFAELIAERVAAGLEPESRELLVEVEKALGNMMMQRRMSEHDWERERTAHAIATLKRIQVVIAPDVEP